MSGPHTAAQRFSIRGGERKRTRASQGGSKEGARGLLAAPQVETGLCRAHAPCSKQRSPPAVRHQRSKKKRASPSRQPPPLPRLELPGVNEEMIIYQGVGQEIGHIQQRAGNVVPAESDGGDGAAWSTMTSLASVFAFGGTAEDAQCICDERRWTGPLWPAGILAAGPWWAGQGSAK